MAPGNPLPQQVLDALHRGEMIKATKLLRTATGLGLKEAKDILDAYERGRVVEVPPPRAAAPAFGAAAQAASAKTEDVVAALRRGSKLGAIALMRQQTGLGLREAKEAVDALEQRSGIMPNGLSPGEVPRAGAGTWMVVLILIAAAGAWYFF
ncbi:MAG: hypothetical protein JWN73_4009 [Betaproteobacteria bacterium]|nr:hypothetical protein [Betaproteobacteria bacterium]